ncbi:MAG: peptidylprolyl isomerase, partial [Bacteroidota bacterium]|nr:peptidylprolyl isomerase [Bacteroidota bacterium]
MKKRINIIACVFVLLFATNLSAQTLVDEVIAVVGKNMIKYSELEQAYIQARSNASTSSQTKCDLLDNMLLNKLLLHQANIDSLEVADSEIDQEMDNRIRYMIQIYGSQERLEKQMQKSLAEIKSQYRDVIKENMLIQQEQNNLTGDIKITPQEVVDFYNKIPKDSLPTIEEEYELTQIVKIPVVTEEEKNLVKEKLNGYRDRILKGDKFTTIATMYSDDEGSARKGGELGFFTRGTMVSEFENVAFSLQPGEVSPVFETKYGFHIIQMIERRGDQINCRHILLQPKISATALYKARTFLDSVKTLIESGNISFEDAIVKFSDDESKINGGLIINKNNASSRFSKDAINESIDNVDKVDFQSMQQGDITSPVEFKAELSDAYRLIKIKRKVEKHTVNLENDFDRLQQIALSEKKLNIMRKWAENLIEKTYIRIDDKYTNCDFSVNWLNGA